MIEVNNEIKTFSQFYEASLRMGGGISNQTKPREVVAISKSTSFAQIEAFIGCLLTNRIPVIVPHPSKKVRMIDFDEKMRKINQAISPSLCLSDEKDKAIFGKYWNTVSDIDGAEANVPQVDPDDIAFFQLSSGTTGVPKVVEVSHKALISHCDEYVSFIGLEESDTIVSWLPLYHDMGLIACFLMPVLEKVNFVHINPFAWLMNPAILFDKIEQHKGTHVWLPNFAFAFLSHIETKCDLSSLRQIINCSEVCHMDDMAKFVANFSSNGITKNMIKVCYALAENVFAVSQSYNLSHDNGNVSCGGIIPGTSAIIVEDGKDVTEEKAGEIYIKSSYEPASNQSSFLGYYKTGDIGYMKKGELYVLGRSDDMIISRGKNIFPYSIEKDVSAIDGVIDGRVACFGVYKEEQGTEEVCVCFESDESRQELDIRKNVLQMIAQVYDIGIKAVCVKQGWITKTSSGKINRKKCRERLINENICRN